MAYVTVADLIARFGDPEVIQLTDRAVPPTGLVGTAVAERAIADAEATVNGYLRARMSLPLDQVPEVIKRITADVARYYLYEDLATERIETRYKDAVHFLESVAKGVVSLGLDGAGQPAPESGGVTFEAPARVFSDDTLAGL